MQVTPTYTLQPRGWQIAQQQPAIQLHGNRVGPCDHTTWTVTQEAKCVTHCVTTSTIVRALCCRVPTRAARRGVTQYNMNSFMRLTEGNVCCQASARPPTHVSRRPLDIATVGSGIGSLTAAVALAETGAMVQVLRHLTRRKRWQGPAALRYK